jgi:hypothetical protein
MFFHGYDPLSEVQKTIDGNDGQDGPNGAPLPEVR